MPMRKLTVMLIPATAGKTRRFQIPTLLLWLTGAAVLAVGIVLLWLVRTNVTLSARVDSLTPLEQLTKIQQGEIEAMALRVALTQEQLKQLQVLEDTLRTLTRSADFLPVNDSGGTNEPRTTQNLSGRGGTRRELAGGQDVPTLTSFLPREIATLLFTQSEGPQPRRAAEGTALLDQVRHTSESIDEQMRLMEELQVRLLAHEQAMASHLDFLHHKPTGLPVTGGRFTDRFGWRANPFGWGTQFHSGLDIAAPYWAEVHATAPGTVVHAGWRAGGYGYTVILEHAYGYQTVYAHLVDWNVRLGRQVERGELLGWVGSSGASTGSHLHYEVHFEQRPVDPTPYLNR